MQSRRRFLRSTALGVAAAGALRGLVRGQAPQAGLSAPSPAHNGTVIDWHTHWIAPGVVDLARRRTPALRLPSGQVWFDVAHRLQHLDAVGVRRQIVSFVGPAYDGALAPAEARPFWRAQNDGLAELVRRHPDRFSALATLPTANVAWAAEELERAHRDLGLIGATLPLDAFVSLEGARSLAPIFAVAQKYRSHLYIHRGSAAPQVPGQHPEVGPTNPYFGLASYRSPNRAPPGAPGDAAVARATLITSAHLATGVITLALTDFLDPYPDVTVQMTMIGGSISFVAEQIELAASRAGLPDPAERFRRVYLDTGASGRGPRGIALAAKVFGADRILFGSDYGPWPSIVPFIAAVNQAAISAEERNLIFVENGRRLLRARGIAG